MSEERLTALVTGASAGIGAEFCRQLAGRCQRIIVTGRRMDRLEALVEELGPDVEICPVAADLTLAEDRERVIQAMHDFGPIDYLVNNAGFGALGPFAKTDLQAQQKQVDLHITATLALTHAALPAMLERGTGYIINISSLAAFFAFPNGIVYSATKVFLNLFSEGLQKEVGDQGIKVQSFCPGYTYSEFHDRDAIKEVGFTRDQVPSEMWMDAAEVVSLSLAALSKDEVVVLAGDDNLAAAREALSDQLKQIG